MGKTGLGDFWDNWVSETEELQRKNDEAVRAAQEKARQREKQMEAEDMAKREALQERYNFPLTDELAVALERLEGLAVSKYRMDDYSYQDSFSKVWGSVQHEVDMYEEGEESPLNKNSCRGAKRWLAEYKHLK